MQDPAFFRSLGKEKGRDGCRVPLPWEAAGSSFGFGPGGWVSVTNFGASAVPLPAGRVLRANVPTIAHLERSREGV